MPQTNMLYCTTLAKPAGGARLAVQALGGSGNRPGTRPSAACRLPTPSLRRSSGLAGDIGGVASSPPSPDRGGSRTTPSAATATATLLHPDAVRRRQEAEARRAQRQKVTVAEQSGHGWWEVDASPNLISVKSYEHFKDLMGSLRSSGQLVVVDFFAPWCRACRSLYPKLNQIAAKNPEVHFLKVNVEPDELKCMSESLGVDRLPYFHFYKGDDLVTHFTANLNPTQLQKLRKEISVHKMHQQLQQQQQ